MFQVPVSYLHEQFDIITTCYAHCLGLQITVFLHGTATFSTGLTPRPTAEVQVRLSGLSNTVARGQQTHLPVSAGRSLSGSLLGQRQKVLLLGEAQAALNAQDYSTCTAFLHLLERLRKGKAGNWQRSAETLSGGVSKFPKGHSSFRAFVAQRDGVLHVLELSGHREERRYQELMQNIRWNAYEHGDWSEMP